NPYCTGVVRLHEGPRIVARIDGVDACHPERIDIGLPLAIRLPYKRPDTPSDASDDASPEPRWVFAHR
ncbi:MAG: OB-fold domain-containing protein, partial [Candidatus Latescibacterota bacterium]|nr:OB-fold domain-containing protein [Candidatus Latescibacterota bacterium]